MSDIHLDFTPALTALALALAGPLLALLLSRPLRPFWPRFAAANLGGPLLASLAGMIADRLLTNDEIARFALLFSLGLQLPIALVMLLRGRA